MSALFDDAVFLRCVWVPKTYKTLAGARNSETYGERDLIHVFMPELLPVVPDDLHRYTLKRHQRLSFESVITPDETARLALFWNDLATQHCGFEFAERMTLAWGDAADRIERINAGRKAKP